MKFILILSIFWTEMVRADDTIGLSSEEKLVNISVGSSVLIQGDKIKKMIIDEMDISYANFQVPEKKELFFLKCKITSPAHSIDSEAVEITTTVCGFKNYICEISSPYNDLETFYMAMVDWQNGYGFDAITEICVSQTQK